MPSELRRGFFRIISNYTRLLVTVIFGLLTVRLLLHAAGGEGWGLVALFASTIGFAAMFEEVMRASMIRELGEAHHSGDPERFRTVFNASLLVSAGGGLLALLIFAVIFACAPLFDVGGMLRGARHLIAAKAIVTVAATAVAPIVNMYLVTERMLAYNFWLVMTQRLGDFAAAIIIVLVANDDPELAIIQYAWISGGISMFFIMLRVLAIAWGDRRLIPQPSAASRAAVREILHIGSWNAGVVTAMNLHLRFDAILVNLFFGLTANAVFGIAVQLTSYTRRISVGVTDGLDAVSTRLSASAPDGAVNSLLRHSTRLHGLAAFPAMAAVLLLTQPLLRVWLGPQMSARFERPDEAIAQTVLLIQVLSVGIGIRSITDGWMRILYGAGHLKRYALLVIAGGLANPLLAAVLVWMLPRGMVEVAGPALAFTVLMFALHGVGLSVIVSRTLGISPAALLAPLARPLVATLLCSPLLIAAESLIDQWGALDLLLTLAAYTATYAICTATFVLSSEERRRLMMAARRAVGRGSAHRHQTSADATPPPAPADGGLSTQD